MGMTLVLYSVTPEKLEQIEAEPSAVETLYEDDSATVDMTSLDAASAIWTLDLDKEWDILGYLVDGVGLAGTLDGKTHFIGHMQSSPDRVGVDYGYGVPAVVRPQSVEHYAAHLEQFDRSAVDARLEPAAVEASDVYCLHADEAADMKGPWLQMIDDLQTFLRTSANCGRSVICSMQ